MAKVVRLLWRLDFEPSYAYLDRRGSALRILTETVPKFWTTMGPGTIAQSFAAQKTEEGKSHTNFSWETTSINCNTEWPAGVEMDHLFDNPIIRGVDRIVKEALKLGEIRVMARAGVRLFCAEKFAKKSEKPSFGRFSQLIDGDFQAGLVKTVGPAEDVAIIYEGTDADGLGYRVQFGPYAPKNPAFNFLKDWGKLPEALDSNDLFFDIDIFEQNLSFVEHSLYRWASTKVAKAATFVEFCSKNIN
ncbi:hypothetical protein [Bradyrhizobium sp. RDM4]|uniref:hypothetical protein n=1 Tax=Bradyrhizobium sp. RDM4 TaxID=3378765 RepID=UPI0038FC6BB8